MKWWWSMRRAQHPQWSHNIILAGRIKKTSVFTLLMTTKIGRVMVYGIGPPCEKSHDSLITWLHVVSRQIKSVMSPIPQVLWTPNLTGKWLMTWNQHPKSRITPSKRFFSFINFFPPQNCTFNDTHRERLVFGSIQYRNGWLAASNLFDMFTQSFKFYTFHYQYRCLKNVIHQIDSKNGWLLLSASFTAKFGLVFVLTLENAFS